MQNNHYQVYTDSIVNLAGSIVIKNNESAHLINRYIDTFGNLGPYDPYDLTTWKYYRNLSGEYYQGDTMMTVTSLDSLKTIEFTKETLKFHRATVSAYTYGSNYYKELLSRFSDQEQLIRGILYPVDINKAIDAKDGAILTFDPQYVESTEYTFIEKLQEWIYGFLSRWDNPSFKNTDNLYEATKLGIMYLNLVPAIINIRLGACKSHEAHSYHVSQYLASHSSLDKYMPYMTRHQQMWFYRNIAYVERNNGQSQIFDALVNKLFTERNIPLADFTMAHELKDMPEQLTPQIVFNKNPINTAGNIDGFDRYSLKEILDIQERITPGNTAQRDEDEPASMALMKYALHNNLPTKLLESRMIDYTDSEVYRRSDLALNHWAWHSHNNLYNAYVRITTPRTGQAISLTAKDSFAFFTYAFTKGLGFELPTLPKVVCNHVQRIPAASLQDMREVCTSGRVSDAWLHEARALMPPTSQSISIEAFHDRIKELWVAANGQYNMCCAEEFLVTRGQKESAYLRLWSDEIFHIGDYPGQPYPEWFERRNIAIKNFSQEELSAVSVQLLKNATGASLASVITLADIQKAMCSILGDLSSYGIQIASTINVGPVLQAGSLAIRTDSMEQSTSSVIEIDTAPVTVMDVSVSFNGAASTDVSDQCKLSNLHLSTNHHLTLDISTIPDDEFSMALTHNFELEVGTMVDVPLVPLAYNGTNLPNIPGMAEFLELTPLEQNEVPDVWLHSKHLRAAV